VLHLWVWFFWRHWSVNHDVHGTHGGDFLRVRARTSYDVDDAYSL